MIGLAVFDLDGTIADSAPQICSAMRTGFAAAGLPAPGAQSVLSVVGLSLPEAVGRLAPGIAAETRQEIVAAYRSAFLADASVPRLYPGAEAALRKLRSDPGMSLAVASGKTRRGVVRVLDQHGLTPLFASLHGGDGHASKPSPEMLHAAMAAAGADAAGTVMVGDSIFDVEMACRAGVPAIGVAWGYGSAETLRAAGAAVIAESFGDLPTLVSRLRMAA